MTLQKQAEAYRLRATGADWHDIAQQLDDDAEGVKEAAFRHAQVTGGRWPPTYLARPLPSAPPSPTNGRPVSPEREALLATWYDAKATTTTWDALASKAGINPSAVLKALKGHARRTLKPWPPTKGNSMITSRQPLAALNVLDDAFGLSNRKTKPAVVRDIIANYDPRAIQTLTGLRRKADKKVFLIDGHHRHEGLTRYCELNNVDPSKFLVSIDIYDESDIPKNMTPKDWIDQLRKALHKRAPETPANEVQRHWITSPWNRAYADNGLDPAFNGSLNFNTITQARLAADTIKARLAAGESAEACLSSFPGTVPEPVRTAAQIAYSGPANLTNTLATIVEWDNTVGSRSRPGNNFRTVMCMTFALLLAEEPANRNKTNIFDTLAANIPGVPDSSIPVFMFSELLFYANYKKHSKKSIVSLLGKTDFGSRRK